MAEKDALGRRGESLAALHLERAGFRILERNWRCRQGELDLVARDGAALVFVEVKTRSGLGFGHPFQSITAAKLSRLRRLASAWIADHDERPVLVRLDAVAVIAPRDGAVTVEHLRGVG